MRQAFAFTVLTSLALAAALPAGAQPQPDIAHGESVFLDTCMACHRQAGGGPGPTLVGVVGRKAAGVPDFAYTPALKDSNLTWTADKLDSFLTNPNAMVPGTTMPMSVPDAKDRADLIAYLASPNNKP